uniref:Uncharacterized protein n=1 Tax=Nomascus leucogenys TaxID=61853 RepID=A0A2I3GNE1_NOMLE
MDSLAAGELNVPELVAYWRKTHQAYATLCPLAKQAQLRPRSVPVQQSYRRPEAPSCSLLLYRRHAAKQMCRT